jgi:hypothetical protein
MYFVKMEHFRPLLYPPLTKGRRGGVKEGNEDRLRMRQEIGAYGLVRQEKRLV